jgi:aminopeptidase N
VATAQPEILLSLRSPPLVRGAGFVLALLLLLPLPGYAAAPRMESGVSLELARWRAQQYRNVQYLVDLDLQAGAARVEGSIEIRLTTANTRDDLVLDWRGERVEERVREITVNGLPAFGVRFVSDHLIIPGPLLEAGENRISMRFQAPIGAATAITRYTDREDGSEYLYTLFVPSDASTVFPCFDQPDLKARFTLKVWAPSDWKVIANAPLHQSQIVGARLLQQFAPTEPISTYLFAFAAGPFVEIAEPGAASPLRLFARRARAERAAKESLGLFRLTRAAINWFAAYFAHPYPFAKYDLVLIPELAYGGMEHAGASLLREESVLFPFEPAATDLLRRANLLLHETSHQWFGDLVTMRWFDDLWLKEGFANFMSAKALEALLPEFPAWVAFHSLKTAAYRTDVTRGTTPIHQPMTNLSAAKSAYGNIVYAKAPGVLRQAEFFIGESKFRAGVRDFIKRHAFGAASWSDLVRALEQSSGQKLGVWAKAWVEHAGLPRVRLTPRMDKAGRLLDIDIEQGAVGGEVTDKSFIWPMKLRVQVVSDGRARLHEVLLVRARARIATPGAGKFQYAIANYADHGYGQFPLDPVSRRYLLDHPGALRADLTRALVLESLWESVRNAELDPERYIELILDRLPSEPNEIIAAGMLARLRAAHLRYLGDARRQALGARVEEFLFSQLRTTANPARRIEYFRAFADLARGEASLARLKDLISGKLEIAGLSLRSRDRFRMLQTLLAADDADAPRLQNELSAADDSSDGRRYAFAAAAAVADGEIKRALYTRFMEDSRLQEAWIEEALGPLNTIDHSALTAPLLAQALAAIPRLKRERKIFFVNEWLGSFIGGQTSRASLQTVERFLAENKLDRDLRLKVLESLDTLKRTVLVRDKFAAR